MDYCWMLCTFLLIFDFRRVSCLLVTDLNVPEIVDFRENVTLSCSYDNDGRKLNSVKWYKDKLEFFRYSPMAHPVYMKFPVTGVQMPDERHFCNESTCRVELAWLGVKSTGLYKCEVSGDAPHFKLAAQEANMTVAVLPQNDPLIENFKSSYRVDESIKSICTSDYSSLPTLLTWYINDEEATQLLGEVRPDIDNDRTIPAHNFTMHRTRMELHIYLSGGRFYNVAGTIDLKCVAEIKNFPDLRRQMILSAGLTHYDNLNNQMLIHASSSGISGGLTQTADWTGTRFGRSAAAAVRLAIAASLALWQFL